MLHDLAALTDADIRLAFDEATVTLLDTLARITDWEAEALGVWSMRELAAHTVRAYTTIEIYLAMEPTGRVTIADATEYFRLALADPAVHDGIAQRGRDGARDLGDPVASTRDIAARVTAVVDATPLVDPIETFIGRMAFAQYLATRVVELTIHTTDLQHAAGLPLALGPRASALTLAVVAPLADPAELIRGITGRTSLHVFG